MLGKSLARAATAVLVVASVAGCDTLRDEYRINNVAYFEDTGKQDSPRPINLDTYCLPYDRQTPAEVFFASKQAIADGNANELPIHTIVETFPKESPAKLFGESSDGRFQTVCTLEKTAFRQASGVGADAEKRRHDLQQMIMEISDRECADHKASIHADQSFADLVLQLIGVFTAGAGTVVTGGNAPEVLAAISTGAQGARTAAMSTIWRDAVAPAITHKIDLSRKVIADEIRKLQRDDDNTLTATTEYSVVDAIRDARLYHEACSFFHGLSEVAKDAQTTLTLDEAKAQAALIDEQIKSLETESAIANAASITVLRDRRRVLYTMMPAN